MSSSSRTVDRLEGCPFFSDPFQPELWCMQNEQEYSSQQDQLHAPVSAARSAATPSECEANLSLLVKVSEKKADFAVHWLIKSFL